MSHLITSPLVLCAMCHSPLTCWLLLPGGHFGTKIFLFLPYFPFCQTTPLSKYPWHNLLIFGSCLKAGLCSETCKILGTDQHMFSRIPQPLLLPKVQQRGTEVNPPFVRSRADGIPVQAKKMLFLPPFPLCPGQAPWQQHLSQSVWGAEMARSSIQTACKAWTQTHDSELAPCCGQSSAVIPIPLMSASHFPQDPCSLSSPDFHTQPFLKNR